MRVPDDKAKAGGDGATPKGGALEGPGGSLRALAMQRANGDERKAQALLQRMLQKKGIVPPAGGDAQAGSASSSSASSSSSSSSSSASPSSASSSGASPSSASPSSASPSSASPSGASSSSASSSSASSSSSSSGGAAGLGAMAYAGGSDIHVAPGQEQHVAHEAAHVVQQGPGKAIVDAPNPPAGDVAALEAEADAMGLAAAKPS